jgi:hypothetical protein
MLVARSASIYLYAFCQVDQTIADKLSALIDNIGSDRCCPRRRRASWGSVEIDLALFSDAADGDHATVGLASRI